MRRMLAIVLIGGLAAPSSTALAGETFNGRLGPAWLSAARAEAARIGQAGGSNTPRDLTGDWASVRTADAGNLVRVRLSNGAEIEGRLVEIREDAIALRENRVLSRNVALDARVSRSDLTYQRAEIASIALRAQKKGHPVRTATLIGLGTGAVIGCLQTYGYGNPDVRGTCWYGALPMGGLGAGIGALVGLAVR